jgi:hypothetical protein
MNADERRLGDAYFAGARLCSQDQPHRVKIFEALGLTDVLRLVFDTAALRKFHLRASACICGSIFSCA